MAKIHFPQFKKEIEISKDGAGYDNLLDYAQKLSLPINAPCNGVGTCGQCRIVVDKGYEALNEKTHIEERFLGEGKQRLACQTKIIDPSIDVYVKLIAYGTFQVLTEEKERKVKLDPLTKRDGNNVMFDGEKIGSYREHIYGIAADIGTTTVVLHLMDLEDGNCVSTYAFGSPQRIIGGDNVMSRISYDKKSPGKLQKTLIDHINREIRNAPCNPHDIYGAVIVGNSTMRDIFFGLDAQTIGVKPYKSITELREGSTFLNKKASELSLNINPNANVYGASLIGSHVGADTTAVCLSTGIFDDKDETVMAIDIGTNGEVVLKHGDRMIATSCAAGSALEPMPGIEGAIERIEINNGKIDFKTIGGVEPVGICGSGIIDLLAEMLKTGEMDEGGYLNNRKNFDITDSIQITQDQIKGQGGLMWSKAAISLGIKALLEEAGIGISRLDRVYLAGSFGNFINVPNARKIGLIPYMVSDQIAQVGNAAAEGARELLLSKERRKLAEEAAEKVEHINLELIPGYGERLMIDEQNFKNLM